MIIGCLFIAFRKLPNNIFMYFMKTVVFFIGLLLLIVGAQDNSNSHDYPPFSEYVQIYNKQYSSDEYIYRENIYQQNILSFPTDASYTPGVNNFTDWTQEEFAAISHSLKIGNQVGRKLKAPKKNLAATPSSLDWREKDAVTPPKNQLNCGSCTAFTATGYAESWLIILGKAKVDQIDLSEQYNLECTETTSCEEGGYLSDAFETATYEMPSQEKYPYLDKKEDSSICLKDAQKIAVKQVEYADVSDQSIIELLQDGPVGASVSSEGMQFYETGIFECPQSAQLDHAVLIIGYTEDYWIIKNSWDTDWGEQGYIRISRERTSNKNCYIGSYVNIMLKEEVLFDRTTWISLGMLVIAMLVYL